MTSRIFISLTAIAATSLTLSHMSAAQMQDPPNAVELDPGLYDYTHSIYAGGQLRDTDVMNIASPKGRAVKPAVNSYPKLFRAANVRPVILS